jgi:hypothetical protein
MIAAARPGHHRGLLLRRGIRALALGWCFVAATSSTAGAATDPEIGIKVGLVYNIVRFVEWPAASGPPIAGEVRFRLGVEGDEAVLAAFMTLAGKPAGGSVVEVVPIFTKADLGSCQMIYFQSPRREMIAQAAGATLTVSDAAGFSREGGMVELVRERNKIRFLVNPGVARARGLQFSSQLLKLATIVEDH